MYNAMHMYNEEVKSAVFAVNSSVSSKTCSKYVPCTKKNNKEKLLAVHVPDH